MLTNRLSSLKTSSLLNSSLRPNSKISSLFLHRSFATTQLTSFDERWKKLTQAEKDQVAKEYEHLQKGDWKSLTIDQKRILYTIAYGVPEIKDSKEGLKIALATASLIGVAVGLFAFIRSFANPPPKTTGNKEWQEASKEILRAQNANPISGMSSKEALAKEQKAQEDDDF